MTEAGGDAAVYIEPPDAAASARTLNQVLEWSPAERMASIERGFANVKRFGRTSLAEHYVAVYREVLASAASS